MNFCLRPSKTIQFDLLEKQLKKIEGEVGLDAAAQNMKNRRMFKTKKYFGIDISLPFLQKGIETHNDQATFGILADLARLEKLPEGSADVIVSTNTLYILKDEERTAAVEHLCRLTAPSGMLICDSPAGKNLKEMLPVLSKNFRSIKIIYFDNIFSRAYEKIFEKEGYLGTHPVAGTKPFLLLSWLISRLEYLTSFIKPLNIYALIICTKKFSNIKNPFEVSHLPIASSKIYNLL
jgi:hypothetical protein